MAETETKETGACKVSAAMCPECGTTEVSTYFAVLGDIFPVRCGECGHRGSLGEFRREAARLDEALTKYKESKR